MSSPEAKNIPLLALLKSTLKIRRPVSQRGGSRSSRTRGGMRWTQAALLTRARACGRRSRVVLTPRRWRQVGGAIYRRRWQQSPVTEESAKETVKTIARGKPDVSGEPVVTNARVYYPPRAATGASDTRLSLRPLAFRGYRIMHHSGVSRRDRSLVMPGLDPGIHPIFTKGSFEEDGLPGQARQ